MSIQGHIRSLIGIFLCLTIVTTPLHSIDAQCDEIQYPGESWYGPQGMTLTTQELMAMDTHKRVENRIRKPLTRLVELSIDRGVLGQAAGSPHVSSFYVNNPGLKSPSESYFNETRSPQTIGLNFEGGSLAQSGEFPPDSNGAVGPSQYIVCINGLIKSFNKNTGMADGALNMDTDTFFNGVRNGLFTSDPRIRYDRLSGRWVIVMINFGFDPESGNLQLNNSVMIAVSNGSTITSLSSWSFFSFSVGNDVFLDYPTLGIDSNALYIGGTGIGEDQFGNLFLNEKVFVVNKRLLLNNSLFVTKFSNILDPITGRGPYTPQGVDNFDPNASTGYFIGVDTLFFGSLIIRKIFNPGTLTPTISNNIILTVPTTYLPNSVPHKGNNLGFAGYVDSIDDRLMMACIRNNQLWTVHNVGVNNHGLSSGSVSITRDGARWYQIDVSASNPKLIQVGTLYQSTLVNDFNERSYFIPSLMISGQGHMALGCSSGGAQEHLNAATSGRLRTDAAGSTQPATLYTASNTAYNPPADSNPGGGPRRWGDFSVTCLDPTDDMTMWTIQEYCDATNSWGVRVAKLIAPPPAIPYKTLPTSVSHGQSSVFINLYGMQSGGAGFYNPGSLAPNQLNVQFTGGIQVLSISVISPGQLLLALNTQHATVGMQDVTITNPDGQSVTVHNLLKVV